MTGVGVGLELLSLPQPVASTTAVAPTLVPIPARNERRDTPLLSLSLSLSTVFSLEPFRALAFGVRDEMVNQISSGRKFDFLCARMKVTGSTWNDTQAEFFR